MSGRVGLEECDATKLVDVLSALETTRAEGVNVRAECAIYVLTNITVNGLETFIDFHALRDGVDVSVQIAPFNVLHQELVSETSQLHATKPNLLVLALGWEGFAGRFDIVPDDVVSRLEGLFDLAASKSAATIAVNTFVLPSAPTERAPAAGSVSGTIQAVNDWIRDYVRAHRDRFFSVRLGWVCSGHRPCAGVGFALRTDGKGSVSPCVSDPLCRGFGAYIVRIAGG